MPLSGILLVSSQHRYYSKPYPGMLTFVPNPQSAFFVAAREVERTPEIKAFLVCTFYEIFAPIISMDKKHEAYWGKFPAKYLQKITQFSSDFISWKILGG